MAAQSECACVLVLQEATRLLQDGEVSKSAVDVGGSGPLAAADTPLLRLILTLLPSADDSAAGSMVEQEVCVQISVVRGEATEKEAPGVQVGAAVSVCYLNHSSITYSRN